MSTATPIHGPRAPGDDFHELPELVFRDLTSQYRAEQVPPVARLILAFLARDASPQTVAFVLPATGPLPLITTFMHALSCAARDFAATVRNGEEVPFKRGDLVHLSPEGWVYEFDGILTYSGAAFIRLKVPRAAEAKVHHIPADEDFRLHRVGSRGATPHAKQKPGPLQTVLLDRLIGVRTGGNYGALPTRVLLLSARGATTRAIESIGILKSAEQSKSSTLAEILTWGRITEDGSLQSEDRRSGGRPPIVATTHSLDHLAAAVRTGTAKDAVVVIDGVTALGNMQALDHIVARRRTAIITDHRDTDVLPDLAARGVDVWVLRPDEVKHANDAQGPLFGPITRAVCNAAELRIDGVPVHHHDLEAARAAIDAAEVAVRPTATGENIQQLIRRIYRLLMTAAEWIGPPAPERLERFDQDAAAARAALENLAMYVEPEAAQHVRDALRLLSAAAHDPAIGSGKAAALMDALASEPGSAAVLMRTAAASAELRGLLGPNRACVLTAFERTSINPVDILVVGAWPSGRTLQRMVGTFVAPRVTVIGYPFEQKWLGIFLRRWHTGIPATVRSAEQKSELTGITGWSDDPAPTAAARHAADGDDPVARYLTYSPGVRKGGVAPPVSEADAREASYIGFVGQSYAYLTAGRSVPVVTDLVLQPGGNVGRIPLRKLAEMRRGDFLLFRDHGDSDVISAVAEQIMGSEQYHRLRAKADSWRAPLASVGRSAALVHDRLVRQGLKKTLETVKGWLRDDDRIGPQSRTDLAIIADAARDERLAATLDSVWRAVCEVRALHRQAGHAVSALILNELPQKLKLIDDAENRVELTFGTGWVVCVEDIASAPEERPSWEVNRVLWADDL